jgi:CRISPR-associated protein Csb1
MSTDLNSWLTESGPVAVTVREDLEPVMGKESVFFPPTFAPPKGSDEAPSYVIDEAADGKVALVDSVGSQANRMEPIFKQSPYSDLVPKATLKIGDREVDLLDVGHRAADAIVRFSDKAPDLKAAFLQIRERGNAVPLARLAPTSLVFGVWDSRDTQVKLPRLLGATIRAYGIERLTRAAQFFAATEKSEIEELGSQDFLSNVGLDDAPAGRTSGGVIARKGIRREAVLNLVALRALGGANAEETGKLRRYVLGLALVALLARSEQYLREGCLLVPTDARGAETQLVHRTGERTPLNLTEKAALEFARAAATEFVVGSSWTAIFDSDGVKQLATKKKEDKARKAK